VDLFLRPTTRAGTFAPYVRRTIMKAIGQDVFVFCVGEIEQGCEIPTPRRGLGSFRTVAVFLVIADLNLYMSTSFRLASLEPSI
jgi:hypothetical protein